MHTHTCKQCGSKFVYCRACVFRPIRYKDLGYCSKECYDESNKIEEVVPAKDVEVVVIKEDTSTQTENAVEYPIFFTETEESTDTTIEETKPKKKRDHSIKEAQKENTEDENQQDYGIII